MRSLDRKLFRDLARLWAQALAIALVIGGAVATFVMAVGSYRSLDETRRAYYERYRFADVFAVVKRAPKSLVDRIAEIPGVAAVDARIAKLALLDIPNFREPAIADLLSTDAVQIKPGAPVRIDGWGGIPIRGRVTRVDPAGFLKVSALGIEEQRVRTTIDLVVTRGLVAAWA